MCLYFKTPYDNVEKLYRGILEKQMMPEKRAGLAGRLLQKFEIFWIHRMELSSRVVNITF